MNQARQLEQSAVADALGEMQRKGITVYRHAGVEFARMPGAERLRVRLTKEQGDATEADLEAPGLPGEDEGLEAGDGVEAGD